MKNFKNKPGIILAEVLLSISLLAIGTFVLSTIISSALSTTALSRNYLIAQNIATEGIEGMKILRDTNWIQEPTNSSCWLRIDPKADCLKQAEIGVNFIIQQSMDDGRWFLDSGPQDPLDLESDYSTEDQYRLYLKDIDKTFFIYTHDILGEPSPYFRSLKILEINTDFFGTYAIVQVKVEWREGTKVRNITRYAKLYNFFYESV